MATSSNFRKSRPQMTAETRALLLTLAREIFGTVGYADAAMEDLTAAVGLTRGALYHHFHSKQGLFTAVVDEIDREMDARVAQRTVGIADGWDLLRISSLVHLEAVLEPRTQRIMLRDAPTVYPGFGVRPHERVCRVRMADTLRALMDKGELAPADADGLARMLAGAIGGVAVWAAESQDPANALLACEQTVHLLLSGLRRSGGD